MMLIILLLSQEGVPIQHKLAIATNEKKIIFLYKCSTNINNLSLLLNEKGNCEEMKT